jgi:hypothetical protein
MQEALFSGCNTTFKQDLLFRKGKMWESCSLFGGWCGRNETNAYSKEWNSLLWVWRL